MIPWLKGNCIMMTRTSEGLKLDKSKSALGVIGDGERKESTNFGTFIEHSEIIGSECPNQKCPGWLLLVTGLEWVDQDIRFQVVEIASDMSAVPLPFLQERGAGNG